MLSKTRNCIRLATKLEENQQFCRFLSSKDVVEREKKYCAQNYHPLPVALTKGEGKKLNYILITKT